MRFKRLYLRIECVYIYIHISLWYTCVQVNLKGAPPLHHSAGASEHTLEEIDLNDLRVGSSLLNCMEYYQYIKYVQYIPHKSQVQEELAGV